MRKQFLTRLDVDNLSQRLMSRGTSKLRLDAPQVASDMRLAATILQWMLDRGAPITTIEIESGNSH